MKQTGEYPHTRYPVPEVSEAWTEVNRTHCRNCYTTHGQCTAPVITEEQLTLFHTKHHQANVTRANAVLGKLDKARKENEDVDMKVTLKELLFHAGGTRLHSLFRENLAPGR